MTLNLITVPTIDVAEVKLAPAAVETRDGIIARAKLMVGVSSPQSQNRAVLLIRELKDLKTQVETARVDIQAPARRVVNTVNGLAQMYLAPIDAEIKRLNDANDIYVARQRAEEAKRREEAERERQRLAAEAAEKIAVTHRSAADAAKASKTSLAAQQALDLGAAQAATIAATAEASAKAVVAAPAPKPDGLRIEETWAFEVVDVWALAQANRNLVTIEPSRSAINASIRNGMRECPGLRIYPIVKTTVVRTT